MRAIERFINWICGNSDVSSMNDFGQREFDDDDHSWVMIRKMSEKPKCSHLYIRDGKCTRCGRVLDETPELPLTNQKSDVKKHFSVNKKSPFIDTDPRKQGTH